MYGVCFYVGKAYHKKHRAHKHGIKANEQRPFRNFRPAWVYRHRLVIHRVN